MFLGNGFRVLSIRPSKFILIWVPVGLGLRSCSVWSMWDLPGCLPSCSLVMALNSWNGPWKKNSHKNEDPVPVFFFPILWCCHIGDDPQGDLAKFGFRLVMKKGHIQQILFYKVFRHLLATKKNGVLFKFGFCIIIRPYQFFCLLIYVNFYHAARIW